MKTQQYIQPPTDGTTSPVMILSLSKKNSLSPRIRLMSPVQANRLLNNPSMLTRHRENNKLLFLLTPRNVSEAILTALKLSKAASRQKSCRRKSSSSTPLRTPLQWKTSPRRRKGSSRVRMRGRVKRKRRRQWKRSQKRRRSQRSSRRRKSWRHF